MTESVSTTPGALEQPFVPDETELAPEATRAARLTRNGVIAVVVVIALVAWAAWGFADNGTVFVALLGSGVAEGAVVTLAALGFVMIFKATGIANFAQGDLITLGAFLGFWATDTTGLANDGLKLSLLVSWILTLVLMFIVGVLIERVAYAPLRGRDIHVVVIATLGVAVIVRTILSLWQGSDPRFLQSWFNPGQTAANFGPFDNGTLRINIGVLGVHDAVISAQRVFIIVVTTVIVVAMMLLFSRTSFGRQLRAVADDREAAQLYGVRANRLSMVSFGLSSTLAGLAGLMIGPLGSFDLSVGFTIMLLSFAAVTLGGFTSIPGILAGGLAIGITEQLVGGQLLPMVVGDWTLKFNAALPYLLMLVVIAVRPQGFFGKVGGRL